MLANPIFPRDWFDHTEHGYPNNNYPDAKFKVGQKVKTRVATDWSSVSARIGDVGTVREVMKCDESARFAYHVVFDHQGEDSLPVYLYENELEEAGMRENPVFDKEWEKYHLGDKVKLLKPNPAAGKCGVIVYRKVSLRPGAMPYYYIRLLDSSDAGWVPEVQLEHLSGYKSNPIFPREWGQGKFKVGDRIEVDHPESPQHGLRGLVVEIVNSFNETDRVIKCLLDDGQMSWGNERFYKHVPFKDSFEDNGKKGQIPHNIKLPKNRPQRFPIGTKVQVGWLHQDDRYRYKVGIVTKAKKDKIGLWRYRVRFKGLPAKVFEDLHLEKPGSQMIMWNNNPIFPTEWRHGKRYEIGDHLARRSDGEVFRVMGTEVIQGIEYFVLKRGKETLRFLTHDVLDTYFSRSKYHQNPIYGKEWEDGRFKVGDVVKRKRDDYSMSGRKGVIMNVTEIDGKVWADVQFDDNLTNGTFPVTMLLRIHSLSNNPIFPKEWRKPPAYKAGDLVTIQSPYPFINGEKRHDLRGKLGLIINVDDSVLAYQTYGETLYEVDPYDEFPRPIWIRESHLERSGGYQSNPVFPKEWNKRPAKFKVGDRVRVKNKKRKHFDDVSNVTAVHESGGVYWYEVWFGDGITNYSEKELDHPFKTNPVFPSEWYQPQRRLKVGDKIEIIKGSYSGYLGIIKRRGEGILENDYLVEFKDDVGYDWTSWVPKDYMVLSEGYRSNPVFPKEWSSKSFKTGDWVKVIDGDFCLGRIGQVSFVAGDKIDVSIVGRPYVTSAELNASVLKRIAPWDGATRNTYRFNPIFPQDWYEKQERYFSMSEYVYFLTNQAMWVHASIAGIHKDGTYDIHILENDTYKYNVVPGRIRRRPNHSSFSPNPIFPQEWEQPQPRKAPYRGIERDFKVGDIVLIKPGLDSPFQGFRGIIKKVAEHYVYKTDPADGTLHLVPIHDVYWSGRTIGDGGPVTSLVDADRLTMYREQVT